MIIPSITSIDKHGREHFDILSSEFMKHRKIYLTGEIDDKLATITIAQIEHLDRQNSNDITMYINSPGGSIPSGLAIMDAMNRSDSDIVTVCTGMAASMGAFLTACGTKGKRYITPHADMMIHQPLLGGAAGQASDIERIAKRIMKLKENLNKILSEKTGQDLETITTDSDRDFYMNATEAINYGLVDKMLDADTQI